jgi:hypothetical protein
MYLNRMNTIKVNDLPPYVNKTVAKSQSLYIIYNLNESFGGMTYLDAILNERIYRCAITTAEENEKLLCIAPSKSLDKYEYFSHFENSAFKVEDTIEGTMINLFWDERINSWEISTKKSIGGNYFYFRNQYQTEGQFSEQKSFKQMFLDAFDQKVTELNELSLLNYLDKTCCYTFVLQHPLNHIVLNITTPAVYLVHMYKFEGDQNYKYISDCGEMKNEFLNAGVKFPRCYDIDTIGSTKEQLENTYEHITNISETASDTPGFMITELNGGFRTVIYNLKYHKLKVLRGNNPNLFYHYLELRKSYEVGVFLNNFPQYGHLFVQFQNNFYSFVSRIYRLYVDLHITKKITLTDIDNKRERFFVEKLHYEVYLPSLKEGNKVKISPSVVESFLDRKEYMMPIKYRAP